MLQFEVLSKAIAFGPLTYAKRSLVHKFDIFVVTASLVTLAVESIAGASFQYSRGVSFLRCVVIWNDD